MLNISSHDVVSVLEQLSSPKSLALAIMARYGDFGGFVHISAEPRDYIDSDKYFRDAQALALFSKLRDPFVPGVDRRAAALKRWWSAEHACYGSNERLSPFLFGSFSEADKGINDFLSLVRKKIVSWIGLSPPDLDQIEGRFGPGATYDDRGRLTTVPDKMTSVPTLTTSACWYMFPYLRTMWGRNNVSRGKGVVFVRGNRFTTVPKSWKTDRAIAIEPAINVFFQLGLGSAIRRRLKKHAGWDLDTAQEVHRLVACESSRTGEFATLDLSNASDTVSINLVKLLLPHRWFVELSALRSPFTHVDGRWVKLEKFSSMGNGYTFELETLIFAAVSSTLSEMRGFSGVLGLDTFVFGDDIIVKTEVAKELITVLAYLGFETNKEKTFLSGPFRESCGADFWSGQDVRPWFRKKPVVQPLDRIKDLNGLRKGLLKTRAASLESWQYWLSLIPLPYRHFRGPSDLGDVVIHDVEENWRFRWKHGIRYFRCVQVKSRFLPWHHWHPDIVLASAVYGTGDGRLGVIPRDPPSKYVTSWVPRS